MVTRAVQLVSALAVVAFFMVGCTGEEATVVDLDATTTTAATERSSVPTMSDEVDPDDPNAEARELVVEAARRQCLDDPDLDEGVVRIVAEATGEVANEYRVDCNEVRGDTEG